MLNPAQISLYWKTWSAVCKEHGWKNSDATRRYALHAQAKCPKSMKDFRNGDFDLYLGVARRLAGSNIDPSQAGVEGERRRLLWRIREDAKIADLDNAYLNKVSTDLYGIACWDELALDDLTKFRTTIHNRAGSHIGQDTRSRQTRRFVMVPPKPFQSRTTVLEPDLAHAEDPF